MEVGFSVTSLGLGPISEVSINREIITAAVYLATKTYGWYKSRERILTLQQTLSSRGVELVAASTFNKKHYLDYVQKHSTTWGIAVSMSNFASRIRLPKGSSAMEGLPGSLCLRALSIGLLCFVDKEQVPSILKDVLPLWMFHYEQEEKEVVIEGPLLAALKQYVISVNTEDGADDLRSEILSYTDSQLQRLTHATTVDVRASEPTELGHIIGLVEWLLTPNYKRQTSFYRTRSLKVWCLALVLSNWFDIEADRTAITAPPDASGPAKGYEYYSNKAIVVLVLAPGWSTDQARKLSDTKYDMVHAAVFAPPRVITVRTFPAIFYTSYVSSSKSQRHPKDARDLQDAFWGTYAYIRHVLSSDQRIRYTAMIPQYLPVNEHQYASLLEDPQTAKATKELLLKEFQITDFSNLLGGKKLTEYIIELILAPMVAQHLLPWCQSASLDQMRLMIEHLRLAAVLAVISLFVRYGDEAGDESGLEMPFLYTESLCLRDSGSKLLKEYFESVIYFLRDMLFELLGPSVEKYVWEKWIPNGAMRLKEWRTLVVKVILDLDDTTERSGTLDDDWGRQRQGLVILHEFTLRPSGLPSSAFVFHALQGHLLDVPTQGGRIVDGISTTPTSPNSPEYLINEAEIITGLQTPAPGYIRSLRMDAEPCWDTDANTSRFVLRAGGLPKLQLSISKLFSNLYEKRYTRIRCPGTPGSCPGPESIHRLLFNHSAKKVSWGFLPLQKMVEQGWLGFSRANSGYLENDESEKCNWLVQTYDSNILLTIALNCPYVGTKAGHHKIVTDCLGAALIARLQWSEQTTIIILANEKHNRLVEAPEPECIKQYDLLCTAASIIFNNIDSSLSKLSRLKDSFRIQACNFICSSQGSSSGPDVDVMPVVERLVYYRDNKGITESGTLEILQAIVKSRILEIDDERDYHEGRIVKVDTLIREWQIENCSAAQSSIMRDCVAEKNTKLNLSRRLELASHKEWVKCSHEEDEWH